MKSYLIADTHLNHDKIKTWCDRPEDFTERLDHNVKQTVKPEDLLIHLGDVGIGDPEGYVKIVRSWPGRKILVRGNHDGKGCQWWMEHGFDFACDAMIYRGCWLTHKPWLGELPEGTHVNLHGHLHNVWDGFYPDDPESKNDEFVVAAQTGRLLRPFHRLFAVEYTDYRPVEFDKFVAKPDKYQARGPNDETRRKMKAKQSKESKEFNPATTIPGWKTAVFYDKNGKQTWRSDDPDGKLGLLGSPHPEDLNGKL
jgi:calcineurin-like phosphoesterase family protein